LNYLEDRLARVSDNHEDLREIYNKLRFYKKLILLFKEFIYVNFYLKLARN
jgi:hypothetical protein